MRFVLFCRLSEYSPPTKGYLPPVGHGGSQLYEAPELLHAKPSYNPGTNLLISIYSDRKKYCYSCKT